MNATIIDRLNATINDRVEANLAQIRGMEAAIATAIADAELIATRRIEAAAESLNATLESQLAELDFRLAVIATNAFAAACDRIAATLDPSTATEIDTTTPEPEPTPEADPVPTREEVAEHLDQYEQEEPADTCLDCGHPDVYCACADHADETAHVETTAPVAAHALETGYAVTAIDEDADDNESDLEDASDDDTPDFDDDSAIMEDAGDQDGDGIATTYQTDDLHEKRGNGRGSRYTPVDFPEPGNVYHRKIDGRWTAVRLVG